MEVSNGKNKTYLSLDTTIGQPYIKYKMLDDVPVAFKGAAKTHTPTKGSNMGVHHYRVYFSKSTMKDCAISVKDGEFGEQFILSFIDKIAGEEKEIEISLFSSDLLSQKIAIIIAENATCALNGKGITHLL